MTVLNESSCSTVVFSVRSTEIFIACTAFSTTSPKKNGSKLNAFRQSRLYGNSSNCSGCCFLPFPPTFISKTGTRYIWQETKNSANCAERPKTKSQEKRTMTFFRKRMQTNSIEAMQKFSLPDWKKSISNSPAPMPRATRNGFRPANAPITTHREKWRVWSACVSISRNANWPKKSADCSSKNFSSSKKRKVWPVWPEPLPTFSTINFRS